MHPLVHLALIWAGVFAAVVAANKTRLTPVLFYLFIGFFLVNIGVLPKESGPFIREFAELGIIFIMFAFCLNIAVPLTIRWWRPYYNAAAARSI